MFLLTLLLNPEDAKPDNFILILEKKQEKNQKDFLYSLASVDNDRSFYPAVIREEEKNTILVKSMVYCLDEMNQPIHPALREEFLSLTPHQLLGYWLEDIQRQDNALRDLFNEKEIQELFKEQPSSTSRLSRSNSVKDITPESSIIPIPLREKLTAELYL